MRILSLFSGAGGLDLGFEKAGFNVVWANEFDKSIWSTYQHNFLNTELVTKSIIDIEDKDLPQNIDGVIGGPPCQAFSEAGKGLGIADKRGQLFFEYLRIIKHTQPKFFLAENVSGMLHSKHSKTVANILKEFKNIGYKVSLYHVNSQNFGVPQDRERIFYIGFRKDLKQHHFNLKSELQKPTLRDAIYDLRNSAIASKPLNKTNINISIPNHEYMTGDFSSIFMSRNRVRSWDEPSFTIQAGGRHAPIHPQAPKMLLIEKDKRIFVPSSEHLYRRLSIRECARIQSFPDDFLFKYENLSDGYKMVGNAVPPLLAYYMANQFRIAFELTINEVSSLNWTLPYADKLTTKIISEGNQKEKTLFEYVHNN